MKIERNGQVIELTEAELFSASEEAERLIREEQVKELMDGYDTLQLLSEEKRGEIFSCAMKAYEKALFDDEERGEISHEFRVKAVEGAIREATKEGGRKKVKIIAWRTATVERVCDLTDEEIADLKNWEGPAYDEVMRELEEAAPEDTINVYNFAMGEE